MNNHPCSSDEAIAAVRRAARQLGYEPAANGGTGANGKRRGRPSKVSDGIRTHNVALLNFREDTSISTSILSYVQRMLAERNLNLVFGHVTGAGDLPQAIRTGNVDGILGYGQFPADAVTPKLERVPAVWMMSRSDSGFDPFGDRVKPDNGAIGQLAARYLIGRGHKRLGFLTPDANFEVYRQRYESFRGDAEHQAAGVDVAMFAGNGPKDVEAEVERSVDKFLAADAATRPTGVFVPVDRVTLRVHRYLERRGVRIGRDVELVSCDNEQELLSLMHPAPPSVDLNRQTIARLAVERLFWRMRHGMDSPRIVITVSPTLGGAPTVETAAAEGTTVAAAVAAAEHVARQQAESSPSQRHFPA